MSDKTPAQTIGEMLDVVTEKLPRFFTDLVTSLYSEEAATNMAKAVGALYKELINAGFKPDDALAMAKDYLNTYKSMLESSKINNNQK